MSQSRHQTVCLFILFPRNSLVIHHTRFIINSTMQFTKPVNIITRIQENPGLTVLRTNNHTYKNSSVAAKKDLGRNVKLRDDHRFSVKLCKGFRAHAGTEGHTCTHEHYVVSGKLLYRRRKPSIN